MKILIILMFTYQYLWWREENHGFPEFLVYHLIYLDELPSEYFQILMVCSWVFSRLPFQILMQGSVLWSNISITPEAGIAQWLERRTRDWKVAGSNPCRSGGRIFFSRVDYLCWLFFRYPFHPRVTAVARKRSRSFCQKCRWQVTVKHAYTLCMWLCMKWHGAWLYAVHRTCAETAAVSCGTSHASAVSTPLQWIFKKRAIKS